jgi:hypothetical protein
MRFFEDAVKDPNDVLHQKEQELERVRREIEALLTVIPLLGDHEPSPDELMQMACLASSRKVAESSDSIMADLETYYPFVRRIRMSEAK